MNQGEQKVLCSKTFNMLSLHKIKLLETSKQ